MPMIALVKRPNARHPLELHDLAGLTSTERESRVVAAKVSTGRIASRCDDSVRVNYNTSAPCPLRPDSPCEREARLAQCHAAAALIGDVPAQETGDPRRVLSQVLEERIRMLAKRRLFTAPWGVGPRPEAFLGAEGLSRRIAPCPRHDRGRSRDRLDPSTAARYREPARAPRVSARVRAIRPVVQRLEDSTPPAQKSPSASCRRSTLYLRRIPRRAPREPVPRPRDSVPYSRGSPPMCSPYKRIILPREQRHQVRHVAQGFDGLD